MGGTRLTPPQRRALARLGRGKAIAEGGSLDVHCDGTPLCGLDTIQALERRGMVSNLADRQWVATESGLNFLKGKTLG